MSIPGMPSTHCLRGVSIMRHRFLIMAAVATTLIAQTLGAEHDEPNKGKPKVTTLSQKDIVEKLDGKMAKVTTVEVMLEPGQGSTPHRHPGPVFGYIIEGEYEWAINDQPARRLKAGDTFYEPTGCLHRVSRNPGNTR